MPPAHAKINILRKDLVWPDDHNPIHEYDGWYAVTFMFSEDTYYSIPFGSGVGLCLHARDVKVIETY
jgi:hypothetical protein